MSIGDDYQKHLPAAISAALAAGREILTIYESDFAVSAKADRSPLTAADTRSHEVIRDALAETGLPLLSEEGRHTPYAQRRNWERLWIVDPLDGTKEFVSRNGEFTVNIALVCRQHPVLGVIYVPVADRLYLAAAGGGAWCVPDASRRLASAGAAGGWREAAEGLPKPRSARRPFTVVGSRSHGNPELESFVARLSREHASLAFIVAGSALKFCRLAEAEADVYPRPAPTMEWDTAAGQCIVEAVGGRVRIWATDQSLLYNREDLVNPGFVACAAGVEVEFEGQ